MLWFLTKLAIAYWKRSVSNSCEITVKKKKQKKKLGLAFNREHMYAVSNEHFILTIFYMAEAIGIKKTKKTLNHSRNCVVCFWLVM